MVLPPKISLVLAMLGLCLRVIDWVFHSPLLDKAATVTSAAAVLSLGAYAIFLILALPEEPPEPDIRLLTYLRAFFGDWLTGMSGPLSVPFAALAVWSQQREQKIIWGCLAAVAAMFGSYRVWRKERILAYEQVLLLKSRLAVPSRDSGAYADKQEVLQLLRKRKWIAPSGRPMTGAGFPMVYKKELTDNSQALKRLGELQLHNLLMEMKAEGLIDCGEHEGNRWFARYG
ncbi:MAG: hypothetical protein DMG84_05980 [Acidobacteria bacterium]|nr:MAG: hypothetical protein DMG84_05980 [Acidobacteriota bacterium]PYX62049.1 MAG: hypothetical protein DMG74_21730 [Acidobacteriota bacterium]